jgi:hypothetical protein
MNPPDRLESIIPEFVSWDAVPRDRYVEMGMTLNDTELSTRDDLMARLPDVIVDSHVHCQLREHARHAYAPILDLPLSSFPWFDLDESQLLHSVFFPGKDYRCVRFPVPVVGMDFDAANRYLLESTASSDAVAVAGSRNDLPYTHKMIDHPRTAGLKMYHLESLPPATTVFEVFPHEVLEHAEARQIPIIFHLPDQAAKLLEPLQEIGSRYPDLEVVLAHVGRQLFVDPGTVYAFEQVAAFPNFSVDTAMVFSKDILSLALNSFGSERVLFGTDEPLGLIRANVYEDPAIGLKMSATDCDYHWKLPEHEELHRLFGNGAAPMAFLQINSLLEVIDSLYEGPAMDAAVEAVFKTNAASRFAIDVRPALPFDMFCSNPDVADGLGLDL